MLSATITFWAQPKLTENVSPLVSTQNHAEVESRVLRILLLGCHSKSLESGASSKNAVHEGVIVNCIQ